MEYIANKWMINTIIDNHINTGNPASANQLAVYHIILEAMLGGIHPSDWTQMTHELRVKRILEEDSTGDFVTKDTIKNYKLV
jgi:hypothetical protein